MVIFASEVLFLGVFMMSEAEALRNVLEIRDGKLKWMVLPEFSAAGRPVQRSADGGMLFKITTECSNFCLFHREDGVGIGNNFHI